MDCRKLYNVHTWNGHHRRFNKKIDKEKNISCFSPFVLINYQLINVDCCHKLELSLFACTSGCWYFFQDYNVAFCMGWEDFVSSLFLQCNQLFFYFVSYFFISYTAMLFINLSEKKFDWINSWSIINGFVHLFKVDLQLTIDEWVFL